MEIAVNEKSHPLDKLLIEIAEHSANTLLHKETMSDFKLFLNYFFEVEYNYRCQECHGVGCNLCGNTGYLEKPIVENDKICSVCGHLQTSKSHNFECRYNHEVLTRERSNKRW